MAPSQRQCKTPSRHLVYVLQARTPAWTWWSAWTCVPWPWRDGARRQGTREPVHKNMNHFTQLLAISFGRRAFSIWWDAGDERCWPNHTRMAHNWNTQKVFFLVLNPSLRRVDYCDFEPQLHFLLHMFNLTQLFSILAFGRFDNDHE